MEYLAEIRLIIYPLVSTSRGDISTLEEGNESVSIESSGDSRGVGFGLEGLHQGVSITDHGALSINEV